MRIAPIEYCALNQKLAGYLAIGAISLFAALVFEVKLARDQDRTIESYRTHATDQLKQVEASVRLKLDHVYQGLRTISMLPSISRIDRHATTINEDAKLTLHQLYKNLANNISVSGIYIVPAGFDPGAIDAVTGKLEEPILSLDDAIVDPTTAHHEESPTEVHEYLQLQQHMAYLKAFYPVSTRMDGLNVPLVSGPSVITCDESEYKTSRRDADRMGIIFSVPFYGEDGALKGTISAIVRNNVLRDLLAGTNTVLVNPVTGYMVGSAGNQLEARSIDYVRNGLADPRLFFSAVVPIALSEPRREWRLWSGENMDRYYASAAAEKIMGSQRLGWAACLLLSIIGIAAWELLYGRKEVQLSQWRDLSTAAMEGLILVRHDQIITVNASFMRMIGEGEPPQYLSEIIRDSSLWVRLRHSGDEPVETLLRTQSGLDIPVEITAREFLRKGGMQRVLGFRDLRERKDAEVKMHFLARHDHLTRLVNLTTFQERLDMAFEGSKEGESFALLSIDLDHFKSVNDTLGHPIGDKLLQTVASILMGSIRDIDTVARIGGDEFIIVQAGAPQPYGAMLLADRIVEALSQPIEIEGHNILIGASVGIAIGPDDAGDAKTLIANADLALYKAKSDGKGRFAMFEPELDQKMRARRNLEADLRAAVAGEQFELHYQPIVNSQSQEITGFEALLRWRHPVRGLVPPNDFIPTAEEMGLMGKIGAWVLHDGCREAMNWPSELWVAINVSPTQFKGRSIDLDVVAALGKSGLPASRLRLEITEGVLLESSDANLETLHRLRNLGVRIAMDDFGTGYSSLSYLSSFHFDTIKIDRSFISDRATSKHSEAVVRAVIGLGGSLGMSTTAEGIETLEQLEQLRVDGCTEMQGFLFSKPVPACEIKGLLSRGEAGSLANAA